MSQRDIIKIDLAKCNGCGECVSSCEEGALVIVNGKAVLRDERSCDGAGACLGHCPQGALTIETREAEAFSWEHTTQGRAPAAGPQAQLQQWPIQLHLVSPQAPYFAGRELLIASSCSPAACPAAFGAALAGRGVVLACPKLDRTEGYVEKLAAIMSTAKTPKAIVLRMEVPCCGGLTRLAQMAAAQASVPVQVEEQFVEVPRR